MPSNNLALPFELNEDLWFDDGDICVCARRFDSGALCLYKLYRDMLAVHSTALLNLLDKSLARRQVYVGDTAYAYIPDDDALDLERFFVAIYYPTYFLFWKHNTRSFSRALPIFRIALKYKANNVIEALASQLEQDWPKTISEWDASQCEDGPCFEPFADLRPENVSLNRAAATEPASAIQVARIANMPNILSAAYYQLSRISSSDVWLQDTVSQLGLTEDCNGEKGGSKRGHGGKIDRRKLLSKEDLRRLALGKERLSKYMLSFRKHLPKELVLHPRCADAWNISAPLKSKDVLTDLLEVCSAKVFPGVNMCSDCRWKVNERGKEERARVWALLPKLFRLPVHPGTS